MKLSIVIPVYNEEATIDEIIGRVLAVDLGLYHATGDILLIQDAGLELKCRFEGRP